MNNIGSLRIYNVTVIDSGIYECIAKNTLGNDTARGTLTVIGKPQNHLKITSQLERKNSEFQFFSYSR